MPKYIVKVPEVWIQEYTVTAESEEEALDNIIINGRLLENRFEFSHILDRESWDIEEDTFQPK